MSSVPTTRDCPMLPPSASVGRSAGPCPAAEESMNSVPAGSSPGGGINVPSRVASADERLPALDRSPGGTVTAIWWILRERLDRALDLVGDAGVLRLEGVRKGSGSPVSGHRRGSRLLGGWRRRSANSSARTFAPRAFSLLRTWGGCRSSGSSPRRHGSGRPRLHVLEELVHRDGVPLHPGDFRDRHDLPSPPCRRETWTTRLTEEATSLRMAHRGCRCRPRRSSVRSGRGRRGWSWHGSWSCSPRGRCSSPATCRGLRPRGIRRR